MSSTATLRVISEDKRPGTKRGVRTLVERILRHCFGWQAETRARVVSYDDVGDKNPVESTFHGGQWKQFPTYERKRVLRRIADRLRLEPDVFVVIHLDADETWTGVAHAARCDHQKKFETCVVQPIRSALSELATQPKREPRSRQTPRDESGRLERLLLLMPFAEIEAWLYRNTDTAIALARRHHGGADVELFEGWRPGGIDAHELETRHVAPKDLICFGDRYNDELARNFPVGDVVEMQLSLAESVRQFEACAPLVCLLAPERFANAD